MRRGTLRTVLLLAALPTAVYVVFVLAPLAFSVAVSFTDWNGLQPDPTFVGGANYAEALTDPLFSNAIRNTVVWMVFAVVVPPLAGLGLALVLDEKVRGSVIYKSLFYLPICLSLAVVGQVWIWIYQPDIGLINTVLRGIGLGSLTQAWLANKDTALTSVMIAWAWPQVSLALAIYLASLASIPPSLIEAAAIDGAGTRQTLRFVTVPLLKPATVVVIALAVINALKGFDVVFVMTQGGPFHSSDNLAMFMYLESFKKYLMGYGSAIAVVLFLIGIVVIVVYLRQVRAGERLYG